MNFQRTFITILLAVLGFTSYAQCGTDHRVMSLYGDQIKDGQHFSEFVESDYNVHPVSHGLQNKAELRTIPVIFHVLHLYGAENISKAQIEDQMRVLNEDFQLRNPDTANIRDIFRSRAANFNIEFKLAQKVPDITTSDPTDSIYTEGIMRYHSPLTDEPAGYDGSKAVGIYPYKNYLNIWVVRDIGDNDPTSRILGYAVFPGDGNAATRDGIVIRSDEVGTIGTSSKSASTLTHEIGHWLGLYHTFQGGCTSNTNWTDRVDDTPPVSGPSRTCSFTKNSCSNDLPNELDMVENYMDYSPDNCYTMFTTGQKERVDFFLSDTRYRGVNISSSTIKRTGVNLTDVPTIPVADFWVKNDRKTVCAGSAIDFVNHSYNGNITSYSWDLTGSENGTSTEENPSVVYNTPGQYTVKLTVSNANGSSTKTHTKLITVLPAVAELEAPLGNDFNEASDLDAIQLEFDSHGWRRNTAVGYKSNACMEAFVNDMAATGVRYEMVLPPVNLSNYDKPVNFNFRVAYAERPNTTGEVLMMYVSTDCGETWRLVAGYNKNNGLVSHSEQAGWEPTQDADWLPKSISLSKYASDNNVMIKLVAVSNGGNSIFVDNINIGEYALSTQSIKSNMAFTMYPNPAQNAVTINPSIEGGNYKVSVQEITGRLLLQQNLSRADRTLNVSDLPNGAYIITVSSNGVRWSQKLIINR